MPLTLSWSDNLEHLATKMFAEEEQPADPFASVAVVIGSGVVEGWLKQFFLFDLPKANRKQRVLANIEFLPLHPFVNDWLAKACTGTPVGKRNPAQHPYSKGAMQWRIWKLLAAGNEQFNVLNDYVGTDPKAADRRRWGLAGKLAQLFDDYQNYRPKMLLDWGEGASLPAEADENLQWQATMWRALIQEKSDSYVNQFSSLTKAQWEASGIRNAYHRIKIFHTTAMPKAYFDFFVEIGKVASVEMYLFNPSKDFWIDDPSVKQSLRNLQNIGQNDAIAWMEPPHPLLNGFGQGIQSLLALSIDASEGQINEPEWGTDAENTLLHRVQQDVRNKGERGPDLKVVDDSIQFHSCHSAMREIEVVRDLILKWFKEHSKSQPRDVQVLIPDFETYAPFIETVFRFKDHNPLIPCVMSQQPPMSAGAVGAAFIRLLRINESRLTAPEVMELLALDPIREAFHLTVDDTAAIRLLVNKAGIRWGRDRKYLGSLLGEGTIPDTVTWRRGLDRMLAGWALGRTAKPDDSDDDEEAVAVPLFNAGELGDLLVCDDVEGNSALQVGILGRFFEALGDTADRMQKARTVADWMKVHTEILDTFFKGTESSFLELAEIRRAIRDVGEAAAIAGGPEVSGEIMVSAMEAHLGGTMPRGNCAANAVLFSPLQTMQATPRKLIVLMGLNEGSFPRGDTRPDFDLIGRHPHYGDPSLRREDRLAFLEALMCARERLILTYTGQSIADNAAIPPSPGVAEFLQYLGFVAEKTEKKTEEKNDPVIRHRLHAFHPDYFKTKEPNGKLFSFSSSNYQAAKAIAELSRLDRAESMPPPNTCETVPPCALSSGEAPAGEARKTTITLDELKAFFVNPAKHFYTNILQVRLADPTRDLLSDSELFDPNELDKYKSNQKLVDLCLASDQASDDSAMISQLQEQALIPLGVFGKVKTEASLETIRKLLAGTSKGIGKTYREILRTNRDTKPTDVSIDCGDNKVTGNLPLLQQPEDKSFAVHFRYASPKAKDFVGAWLDHIAGHAQDGKPFTTVVIGKEMSEEVIPPLPRDTARTILEASLNQYRRGMDAVLPFAPETSMAFVEVFFPKRKKKDRLGQPAVEPPPSEDFALEKAFKEWFMNDFSENKDAYQFLAWGEDGPMEKERERFIEEAYAFWRPYFENKNKAENSETEARP